MFLSQDEISYLERWQQKFFQMQNEINKRINFINSDKLSINCYTPWKKAIWNVITRPYWQKQFKHLEEHRDVINFYMENVKSVVIGIRENNKDSSNKHLLFCVKATSKSIEENLDFFNLYLEWKDDDLRLFCNTLNNYHLLASARQ